ncbi:hypothetical protein VPH35_003128 [Triticum aestivum]
MTSTDVLRRPSHLVSFIFIASTPLFSPGHGGHHAGLQLCVGCRVMLLLLHPTADDLCQARPATFDLGVALPLLAASCCRPFPWVREAPSLVRGLVSIDAPLFSISIVSLGSSNLELGAQVGRLRGCASHLWHFGSSRTFQDSPSTTTSESSDPSSSTMRCTTTVDLEGLGFTKFPLRQV